MCMQIYFSSCVICIYLCKDGSIAFFDSNTEVNVCMQLMWTVFSHCLWGKNETEPREGEVELHAVLTEATLNPAELSGTKMTL